MVRIPRERESSHVMMMGDTGAGKSSLIRQILMQVEERGETAIVYDPALEYTPQLVSKPPSEEPSAFRSVSQGHAAASPADRRQWRDGCCCL